MDSTYAGVYGKLKAESSNFLTKSQIEDIIAGKDFLEVLKDTWYGVEINALSALYKTPELIDIILNAHLARLTRKATGSMPTAAGSFIRAYISKWDMQNVSLVLSSKVLGYAVSQNDALLLVNQVSAAGAFGGAMSKEDFVNLEKESSIEGVVNALFKYGYGGVLSKYLEDVKKTNDISTMIVAMQESYYASLIDKFRFYEGNEWPVREFILESIDIHNIVTALKSAGLSGNLEEHLIKGGKLPASKIAEITTRGPEVVQEITGLKLDDALTAYKEKGLISYFEMTLERELHKKYLRLFKDMGISLGFIMYFIMRLELEKDLLRTIWFTKYYGMDVSKIPHLNALKESIYAIQ